MSLRLLAALVVAVCCSAIAVAQDRAPEPAQEKPGASAPASSTAVPLRVTVVISRYQGEKKIGSLPYTFGVVSGERTNLRMGSEVPIVSRAPKGPDAPQPSVSYRGVGTNIDCGSDRGSGGVFRLSMIVEDTSVHLDPAQKNTAGNQAMMYDFPSFRTLRLSFTALLRDGQTTQHTSATDPITGELMRVDVALNVVK